MELIDTYYRAFKEYRKETLDKNECKKHRNTFIESNVELDRLEAIKYLCTIHEDWVEEIEKGLVFVEKAVREERQFIRQQGEVVPIEKAKKISKYSVEHLAKHSEMITHLPENEGDIIPDEIYMVEKLSDYAVYENRFLYMLLCYLRDFINLRLEKILKIRMTYMANLYMKKQIEDKKNQMSFELVFSEKRLDNPYPIPDTKSANILTRIEASLQLILMLLQTDLMVQVAKTPMIKPPIVKTNVLKMNNNFKNAVALYDYVASYKGDGFTVEEVKKEFMPFDIKTADELAEIVTITSYLSYKYGNEIEEILEEAYQREEKRRRDEDALKLLEQIKRLKKHIYESNSTMEEYIILLEKRNKMLEEDSEELRKARKRIDDLNDLINNLNMQKEELNRQIISLEAQIEEKIKEINELNQKYINDMAEIKKKHELRIEEINALHEDNINTLNEEHNSHLEELRLKHEDDLINARSEAIKDYDDQINSLNDEVKDLTNKQSEIVSSYNLKINQINEKINIANNEKEALIKEYDKKLYYLENNYEIKVNDLERENKALDEKKTFYRAELNALRAKYGLLEVSDELTSKERFLELEEEFEAFNKFFKTQWKRTKKEIRRQILWTKEEKEKKKNDENDIFAGVSFDDEE